MPLDIVRDAKGSRTHDGGSVRPSFLLRSCHGLVLLRGSTKQRRSTATATATATAPVTKTVGRRAWAWTRRGWGWLGVGLWLWLLGRPSLQD